jgi:rubrerythrin
MPEFGNPFAGLALERKVTHEELVRAIRYSIAAEYEAIQLYMQLAESTDNEKARAVLMDVANEERVHAGEFLQVIEGYRAGRGKVLSRRNRGSGRNLPRDVKTRITGDVLIDGKIPART